MKTILQRIQNLGKLSNAEKKLALYFERNYPLSITGNINQLSLSVGVSVASVSRFIQKLGYDTFSSLRVEAESSIKDRLVSPIERYKNEVVDVKDGYGLNEHLSVCINNISETVHRIDKNDFRNAVDLIMNAKKLYIVGGASAFALAEYFAIFARYMRNNVTTLSADISTLAHKLVDVGDGDVLLAIAHYRVSSVSTNVAKFFKEHGHKVVLISDRSSNSIGKYADITLPVVSTGTPMFNSRVATLAVLESIFNAMIPLCEADLKKRFGIMEHIFADYNVYHG